MGAWPLIRGVPAVKTASFRRIVGVVAERAPAHFPSW
jgi:hypothetical protein